MGSTEEIAGLIPAESAGGPGIVRVAGFGGAWHFPAVDDGAPDAGVTRANRRGARRGRRPGCAASLRTVSAGG